jgi:mono/diheme cytochrome c family protein
MGGRFATWWSAIASVMAGGLLLLIGSDVMQRSIFAEATVDKPIFTTAPAGNPTPGEVALRQQPALKQAAQTVLDGVYTASQADRGEDLYVEHCASCHDGADVDGPPLAGEPFIDRWREDTLSGLFDFVKTSMPQTAPGSLPQAAYLDILAYLLHENEYPAGQRELAANVLDSTLLVGPNGLQPLPSGALVSVVGCLTQNPAREWTLARSAPPTRVRTGNDITVAEGTAAAAAALGAQTFALQNVGGTGTSLPGEGHKVLVKGALTQRSGTGRIHVTAARSVADMCR